MLFLGLRFKLEILHHGPAGVNSVRVANKESVDRDMGQQNIGQLHLRGKEVKDVCCLVSRGLADGEGEVVGPTGMVRGAAQ